MPNFKNIVKAQVLSQDIAKVFNVLNKTLGEERKSFDAKILLNLNLAQKVEYLYFRYIFLKTK